MERNNLSDMNESLHSDSFKEVEVVWVNSFSEIYVFEKKIGYGQYGKVWTAIDQITSRPVVCKIVDRKSDYVRELDHLISLRSCYGVLPIKKAVFTNGQMCMEFDMGKCNLTQYIRNRECNNIKDYLLEAVKITYQLLYCLSEMHAMNIIHRDLKSGNVVMLNNKAWIIDFGMSKRCLMQDKEDLSFYEIVTCTYRAPELWKKISDEDEEEEDLPTNMEPLISYDSKIDIWSVGCILYELIVKESPFNGDKETDVRKRIAGHLQFHNYPVSESLYDSPCNPVDIQSEITRAIEKYSIQCLCYEMEDMNISPKKDVEILDKDSTKIIKIISKLIEATLHPDPNKRFSADQCLKLINKNHSRRKSFILPHPHLELNLHSPYSSDNWTNVMTVLFVGSDFYKINPRIVYLAIYNWIRIIGTSQAICKDFSLITILLGCLRLACSYCGEADIEAVKYIRRHIQSNNIKSKRMEKSPKKEVCCSSSILYLLQGKIWINNPGEYRQQIKGCKINQWNSEIDQIIFSLIISDLTKKFQLPDPEQLIKRTRQFLEDNLKK